MNIVSSVYILNEKESLKSSDYLNFLALVSQFHDVIELTLEQALLVNLSQAILIYVNVIPSNFETVSSLKFILKKPRENSVPIYFILDDMDRKAVVQAQMLGASDIILHPINVDHFIEKLATIANQRIEELWKNLSKIQEAALKVGLKALENLSNNIKKGVYLSNSDIKESCDLIIHATKEEGLKEMLLAVREHHNYTYRHSMMVSGYLSAFGLLLGINGIDLQNLTIGGLLHDIGKAHVNEKLLNKPGPLTDDEWIEMKEHAEYSRKILAKSDYREEIVDAAVHHHERLDGTGYPDGLSGKRVSDIARMVAIADVFSGLTEKRAYKKSMSNEKAYKIMLSMDGHLDMALLSAFKPIALNMNY